MSRQFSFLTLFLIVPLLIHAITMRSFASPPSSHTEGWHSVSNLVMDAGIPEKGLPRLLFPGGKPKAFTMSCDDGRLHDQRFVEILNRHGIRGTFNLNSFSLDKFGHVKRDEVHKLYAGHEIGSHSFHHKALTNLSDDEVRKEITENLKDLESLAGYPIRGLAYPNGEKDDRIEALMPKLGLAYARSVDVTHKFTLPSNPYSWSSTCQFKLDWLDDAAEFLARKGSPLFMLTWGHSFDFGARNKWHELEEFCKKIGGRKDVWYATCIEVADYVKAAGSLQESDSGMIWKNPSSTAVCLQFRGSQITIEPNSTLDLDAVEPKK